MIPETGHDSSPLVDEIPAGTSNITLVPSFGSRLEVRFFQGIDRIDVKDVYGVTFYGDGRVVYHQPPEPEIHCGRTRPHEAHGGGDDSYRCPGTPEPAPENGSRS